MCSRVLALFGPDGYTGQAGCICTMPVIRPSGSSSLGTITKDHADELIANGTCKEWSYKCDSTPNARDRNPLVIQ